MRPSRAPHSETKMVNRKKMICAGDVKSCPDKAMAARAMDVMKKTRLRMIFFFSRGVVIFRNLNLPSVRPVAIARIKKNGSMTDKTFIVEDRVSMRACGTKKAKKESMHSVKEKACGK